MNPVDMRDKPLRFMIEPGVTGAIYPVCALTSPISASVNAEFIWSKDD